MTKTIVSIKNLNKTFTPKSNEPVVALNDVNLDVFEDEFVSIIGPSGCGKSTLLRIVSKLEDYDSGTIEFYEEDAVDETIGFVFQDSVLLPWKTVYQNAIFPLEVKGLKNQGNLDYVDRLLETTGLSKFKNSLPKELSGGMRQRVSIVRSLSYNPKLLLMDEPFGALDAITRDSLNLELAKISQSESMTVMFVTHDIEEAVFLSTKVVVMSPRPGEIKEIVDINLPKERNLDLKTSPEFRDYIETLRGLLDD